LTIALGVKDTNSVSSSSLAYTENYGGEDNVGALGCVSLLYGNNTGITYYIFAKAKTTSSGNNNLLVSRLGPGNIN
jgi:hypothetical protein